MKINRYLLSAFFVLGCTGAIHAQTISTVAGTGTAGYTGDGTAATTATLSTPSGVALDGAGNLYIADAANNVVRKLTSAGIISTFAGSNVPGYSGDGAAATAAKLFLPVAVAVDASNNVYISDNKNNVIRKVTVATGIITTYAGKGTGAGLGTGALSGDGGPATAAEMWAPVGIAFDGTGNLYVADDSNNRVREVTPAGIITTFAGSGIAGYLGGTYSGDGHAATAATLHAPAGVAVDASGDVFISDPGNNRIREVTAGVITTFAGNGSSGFLGDGGPAGSCEFNGPAGLGVDASGDLYIADAGNNRIRMVNTLNVISTVAGGGTSGLGDGGAAVSAMLSTPSDVTLDATGIMYIADAGQNRVRRVTALPSIKILGTATVCIGKTTTLTDATTGGTWSSSATTVATVGTSGTVTGVTAGTATITYKTGSNVAYQSVTVTNCKAAVNAVPATDNGLKVYPNPNEGTFTVLLSSDNNEQAIVTITNIIGAKVKEFKTTTNTPMDIQVDVPSGIYFLNATTPNGRWSEKINILH